MTVITGADGYVELRRISQLSLRSTLGIGDVSSNRNRFSCEGISSNIVTGDLLRISTIDGSNLELVSGHNYNDGSWFVHCDAIGGLRLYDSFEKSITGSADNCISLVVPSSDKEILITVRDLNYRPVAKIREFSFTTNRDRIQTDILGAKFKEQYDNGLIQGQGEMECMWEHRYLIDDPLLKGAVKPEFASYLARLALRLDQGSDFEARFYLYREEEKSSNNAWYECSAQVTSCAIEVPAAGLGSTRIEFVTSGQIELKVGILPGDLLATSTDRLLQEDGGVIYMEDDAS